MGEGRGEGGHVNRGRFFACPFETEIKNINGGRFLVPGCLIRVCGPTQSIISSDGDRIQPATTGNMQTTLYAPS